MAMETPISHGAADFLVGGLVAIFYFPINIGCLIIPIDELIFFRGVAQPPSTLPSWMAIPVPGSSSADHLRVLRGRNHFRPASGVDQLPKRNLL